MEDEEIDENILTSWDHLWWPSRVGGGGLVVVEDHHDQQPVAAEKVPDYPVGWVGAEDDGQHAHVDDDHHRGDQQDHQADKRLRGGQEMTGDDRRGDDRRG